MVLRMKVLYAVWQNPIMPHQFSARSKKFQTLADRHISYAMLAAMKK